MALSKDVQDLVDRVAASMSLEASSAAAMVELVNQSAQLQKKVDDLVAAGTAMSSDDATAVQQAVKDLAASAAALQAAVPQSVTPPPVAPADIPVATPPVV